MCLSAHRGGLEADYDVGQKSEQNKLPRSNGPQCPVHMHTVSPPLSLSSNTHTSNVLTFTHKQSCTHVHTLTHTFSHIYLCISHMMNHPYLLIYPHMRMCIIHTEAYASIYTISITSQSHIHTRIQYILIHSCTLTTPTHTLVHTHTQVHCCCSHTHVPMRQLICV